MKTQIKQTAFLALIFFTFSCSKSDEGLTTSNIEEQITPNIKEPTPLL